MSTKRIATGLLMTLALCGGAFAATGTAKPTVVPGDCQRSGANVSALIDSTTNSTNVAGARAAFQRGIMLCMEGDDVGANAVYQQATDMLTNTTTRPPVPAVSPTVANTADCQTTGATVSALIDSSGSSPNVAAARAAFQRGIMLCMEGDDLTANNVYETAKKLLAKD